MKWAAIFLAILLASLGETRRKCRNFQKCLHQGGMNDFLIPGKRGQKGDKGDPGFLTSAVRDERIEALENNVAQMQSNMNEVMSDMAERFQGDINDFLIPGKRGQKGQSGEIGPVGPKGSPGSCSCSTEIDLIKEMQGTMNEMMADMAELRLQVQKIENKTEIMSNQTQETISTEEYVSQRNPGELSLAEQKNKTEILKTISTEEYVRQRNSGELSLAEQKNKTEILSKQEQETIFTEEYVPQRNPGELSLAEQKNKINCCGVGARDGGSISDQGFSASSHLHDSTFPRLYTPAQGRLNKLNEGQHWGGWLMILPCLRATFVMLRVGGAVGNVTEFLVPLETQFFTFSYKLNT